MMKFGGGRRSVSTSHNFWKKVAFKDMTKVEAVYH